MYEFSQERSVCIVDACKITFQAAQDNNIPILIGGLETKTCVYVQKQDCFIEKIYITKSKQHTKQNYLT